MIYTWLSSILYGYKIKVDTNSHKYVFIKYKSENKKFENKKHYLNNYNPWK